jgi:hypothetical protein
MVLQLTGTSVHKSMNKTAAISRDRVVDHTINENNIPDLNNHPGSSSQACENTNQPVSSGTKPDTKPRNPPTNLADDGLFSPVVRGLVFPQSEGAKVLRYMGSLVDLEGAGSNFTDPIIITDSEDDAMESTTVGCANEFNSASDGPHRQDVSPGGTPRITSPYKSVPDITPTLSADLDRILDVELQEEPLSVAEPPHDRPQKRLRNRVTTSPQCSHQSIADDEYVRGFGILPSSDNEGDIDSDDSGVAPHTVPLIPVGQITDVYRVGFQNGSDREFSAESACETDVSSSDVERSPLRKRQKIQPQQQHQREAKRPPNSGSAFRRPSRGHSESDSSNEDGSRGSVDVIRRKLPKTQYGRPRRILVPANTDLPFVTLSMRADVQFFHRTEKYESVLNYDIRQQLNIFCRFRITDSLPHSGPHCHVEDAVVVEDITVIGYDEGPCQVSLITMKQVRHIM